MGLRICVSKFFGDTTPGLPRWNKPCCYSRSLMVGGDPGLWLLCANIHLSLLNGAAPCLQWCPGYPSVESLVYPVQRINLWSSAVAWLVRGRLPPVFSLSYAHTIRGNVCVSNSWILEGVLQWFAICSSQYSPPKSVTTRLSAFHNISNLFQLLFPWGLCYFLLVSMRGNTHKTDSSLSLNPGSAAY